MTLLTQIAKDNKPSALLEAICIIKEIFHKFNIWGRRDELAIRLMKERPLSPFEQKLHDKLFKSQNEWIDKTKLKK